MIISEGSVATDFEVMWQHLLLQFISKRKSEKSIEIGPHLLKLSQK